MSDRMKMDKRRKELIGKSISKQLEEKYKNQEKIKKLNLIKENILSIKNIALKSNISEKELKKLFQECDLSFWDKEIKDIHGIEEKNTLESTPKEELSFLEIYEEINFQNTNEINEYKEPYDIEKEERLNNIHDYCRTLDAITDYESTHQGVGSSVFNSIKQTINEENISPEKYKKMQRIINELDKKLSNMTKEEREELFKKMGFILEEQNNNKKNIKK